MNGKEERFFENLCAGMNQCRDAGGLLRQVMTGEQTAEADYEEICRLEKEYRKQLPILHEKLEKAFSDRQRREAARQLTGNLAEMMREIQKITQNLYIGYSEAPEAINIMAELAACALLELSRMTAYSRTIRTDYMKVEARAQRVRNYEERGSRCFCEGMRALLAQESRPVYVMEWKEMYERTEKILDLAEESAEFFQKLMQECV